MAPDDPDHGQSYLRGTLIRGGTSKGLFVRGSEIPVGDDDLDALLLEIMGSPDPDQIDGIGGGSSSTSKFVSVSPSSRIDADVEYTFAQVGVEDATVDWSRNCGNLTSAVGVFALLEGLVSPVEPATRVDLYNTNSGRYVSQVVPTADGGPAVDGRFRIAGVPGTGTKIESSFRNPGGGRTGHLLPTGAPIDTITVGDEAFDVSIVDATNLTVFVRAADLGMSGTELPDDIADRCNLTTLEAIRGACEAHLGIESIPLVAVVAEPQSYECSTGDRVDADDIDVTSRALSLQPHHAYPITGAMCLGTAVNVPGSIPSRVCRDGSRDSVTIGHPKGTVTVGMAAEPDGAPGVEAVTNYRTARPLVRGRIYY